LPSIGSIRFARRAVFIVDVMTVLSAVLFVGWREDWRVLPLSLVFKHSDTEVYSTASIDRIGRATDFADAFLQLPVIALLLLAIALLTAFYLWLHDTETRLAKASREV
jgi:hypothetical protein